ncbi:MAG: GTPase [Bacilli bacterium]
MNDKYCLGCGVKLQDENVLEIGYTTSLENELCQRCFRMKNYGEYQIVVKNNDEYISILKSINNTNDLVLYVVDVLNMEEDLAKIKEYINNNMILVLNKRDAIPKSVKDDKIIEYIKNLNIDFKDIIMISSKKNYNIDYLLNRIKYYQTSKNVYVVGNTNSGKSTLINTLMKNYSDNDYQLTMSAMPSTTLNKVSIELNDYLTLIDTPGLVDSGSIVNYVDETVLKKLVPKKEIKPKTYQIKEGECLIIDDLVRIDYEEGSKNSFTIYMSNDLKVKRLNGLKHDDLKELNKISFETNHYEDIVINGMGFIKIVDPGKVNIYIDQKINVFKRKSLI